MTDPKKLLETVISLIELDVKHIGKAVKSGKLEHTQALDLTRYVSTLRAVIAKQAEEDADDDAQFKNMSLESLREAARRELAKLESK